MPGAGQGQEEGTRLKDVPRALLLVRVIAQEMVWPTTWMQDNEAAVYRELGDA